MTGWEHPEAAHYYEAFCRNHDRYMRANEALIANARIVPDMRVLDLAAGTGRTAEAVLGSLGADGRMLCVEPSAAMRTEGMRRVTDPRVAWSPSLPAAAESFDRIVCGASIWQMNSLPETFRVLTTLLHSGGALCFNVPALYLMEPDEPGGGDDPLLLTLPALLATAGEPQGVCGLHGPPRVDECLRAAGLRGESWSFTIRVTQQAYADWLKIPVLTDRLLSGLPPAERARRIDAALALIDCSSWKWERWRGWTAWKD